MSIKEILEYWKTIIAFIILIVGATIGVIAWAEDQKALIRAEQHLIHNELYQESRIQRKADRIRENKREIELLTEYLTEENNVKVTNRIQYLEQENIRLESDIEEIRSQLATKND